MMPFVVVMVLILLIALGIGIAGLVRNSKPAPQNKQVSQDNDYVQYNLPQQTPLTKPSNNKETGRGMYIKITPEGSSIHYPQRNTNKESTPPITYKKKRTYVNTFIAIDVETTGLHPNNSELLEIAAVKFNNGEQGEMFHSFIKPSKSIPPEITAINGFNDEMVANAPSAADIMPDFFKFIGKSVLVAHKAEFNMRFILHEAKKLDYTLDNAVACTISCCEKQFPAMKNYKLETIASSLGISIEKRHSSFHEAIVCGIIYNRCRLMAAG